MLDRAHISRFLVLTQSGSTFSSLRSAFFISSRGYDGKSAGIRACTVAVVATVAIVAVSLLTFASPAEAADLLLEPYAGLGLGSMKATYSDGSGDLKYSTNGLAAGARVAIQFPVVYIGADYNVLISQAKTESNPHSYFGDSDLTGQALFGVVGVHLPLIRAWAGYGVISKLDFAASDGYSARAFNGTAWKLGAGFTGLPFIDLNLEYLSSTYSSRPSIAGETFRSASQGLFLATVSLPLTF